MRNVIDLQQENSQLKAEIAVNAKQLASQSQRIQALEELLRQSRQQRFAASSEKLPATQLKLFDEAEAIADTPEQEAPEPTQTVAAHQRRKPRTSIPAHYPRETITYTLPDDQQHCPHDGTLLKAIGTEDHEQLDIIPAQVKVIRHSRQKYMCPCCEQYHAIADKPKQPIEKRIASPGLLAHIAVQKYADALPLYRQSAIFKRAGIELTRANLANWMIRCGELSQPLINLLQDHLLEQAVLHMDETPLQVPMALLSPEVNTLMVDGYSGYQPACDDYGIIRLGCWAHARRYLVTAKKLQKAGKAGKVDQGLAYIQRLYALERALKDKPLDERYQQRQTDARPILDKLRQWLDSSLPQVLPKSAIGKALTYLDNQWSRLIGYVNDGQYPIDNNPAENAIRPFTVGRKNWLFANSQSGAKASANLYSLVETAKANGLNPYDYLKILFEALPNVQRIEDYDALLPCNISKGE